MDKVGKIDTEKRMHCPHCEALLNVPIEVLIRLVEQHYDLNRGDISRWVVQYKSWG